MVPEVWVAVDCCLLWLVAWLELYIAIFSGVCARESAKCMGRLMGRRQDAERDNACCSYISAYCYAIVMFLCRREVGYGMRRFRNFVLNRPCCQRFDAPHLD